MNKCHFQSDYILLKVPCFLRHAWILFQGKTHALMIMRLPIGKFYQTVTISIGSTTANVSLRQIIITLINFVFHRELLVLRLSNSDWFLFEVWFFISQVVSTSTCICTIYVPPQNNSQADIHICVNYVTLFYINIPVNKKSGFNFHFVHCKLLSPWQ